MRIASLAMRVIGILLVAFGAVVYFYGYNMKTYYYVNGATRDSVMRVVYIAAALAIGGIVLILISVFLTLKERRQFFSRYKERDYDGFDNMVAQISGNEAIFDVFHSEDNTKLFSVYRDMTCILKQGDRVIHGRLEPVSAQSEEGPWTLTMETDDGEKSGQISQKGSNILLKTDVGEEIFYRN